MPQGKKTIYGFKYIDCTYINSCRPAVRQFYLELLKPADREGSSITAYKLLDEIIFVDKSIVSDSGISDATLALINSKL